MSQKYAWPLWIYRVISAVNVDGTHDVTYDNGSWDKNVAPELLKAVMRRKSTRRKRNPTWTMAPVVNTPWSDASILNDKNLVQGSAHIVLCILLKLAYRKYSPKIQSFSN
jgi:hypothetical protein